MAGTYSRIYIQVIFTVKGRENLLQKPWRERVFKYIFATVEAKKQKCLIVNGTGDHVHVFVSMNPSMRISDLVRDIKNNSSNFINEQKFLAGKFAWQTGYGVFSYSRSQIDQVYQYIAKQEEHHKKRSFKEEYLTFLKSYEIEYQEKYLFDW
tara:strand:- start:63894 stop:64349 length:456 start_codon:yes stop_codon:yes gene_type:complete